MEAGQKVQAAGMTVVLQRPLTAKGVMFVSLEDEAGLLDLVVRPNVVAQTKKLPEWGYGLNGTALILVEGIVQRNGGVTSLLMINIYPLIAATLGTIMR